MEMVVKSSLIKKYRSERLWSQEQLAKVSGLGIRTIQRLESGGAGSMESIKALAAVFGVAPHSLLLKKPNFEIYQHRQLGIATFMAMPLVAGGILAANSELQVLPGVAEGMILLVLALVTIVFSSMTIEVDGKQISWFFGPGFFRKRVRLDEVAAFTPVRNPIWMGFGIHTFGTGWIYNVSGLLGVEIELAGGSYIRLGTDEPNFLVKAIQAAKAHSQENA